MNQTAKRATTSWHVQTSVAAWCGSRLRFRESSCVNKHIHNPFSMCRYAIFGYIFPSAGFIGSHITSCLTILSLVDSQVRSRFRFTQKPFRLFAAKRHRKKTRNQRERLQCQATTIHFIFCFRLSFQCTQSVLLLVGLDSTKCPFVWLFVSIRNAHSHEL